MRGRLIGGLVVVVALAAAPGALASGWTMESFPSAPHDQGLFGVSCPALHVCFATEAWSGTEASSLPLVARWNGSQWSEQKLPTPAGARDPGLDSISCSSTSFCMAVGYAGNSESNDTWWRWNGSRWSVGRLPEAAWNSGGIFSLSCSSANACLAVGYVYGNAGSGGGHLLAERWNGSRWSTLTIPNANPAVHDAEPVGVSCSSANACTAVGTNGNTGDAWVLRWNGTGWSTQKPALPPGGYWVGHALNSVSCPSQDACTAVGRAESSTGRTIALAERWNGTSWSVQSTPPAGGGFWFVSCPTAAACTAVGTAGSASAPFAQGWNGSQWSSEAKPPTTTYAAVNGLSCSAANACTLVQKQQNGRPLVDRYT